MKRSIEFRGEQLADDPNLLNESRDVFTRLVAANDERAKCRLDNNEVVSTKASCEIVSEDDKCLYR